MRAFILEDSRLARQGLRNLLSEYGDIHIVGEAETVHAAQQSIASLHPDLLFVDIDLPDGTGLQVLGEIDYEPLVIFTTAYSEYAVESFEFNTVDYLLKPIEPVRLAKALKKMRLRDKKPALLDKGHPLSINSQVFLKDKENVHLIALSDIAYFESCGNYVRAHFGDQAPFINKSLSAVEQRLPAEHFLRANRQHLVNLNHIEKIEDSVSGGLLLTMHSGMTLPCSRANAALLKQRFSL